MGALTMLNESGDTTLAPIPKARMMFEARRTDMEEAFRLRVLYGKSFREIGEALGVKTGRAREITLAACEYLRGWKDGVNEEKSRGCRRSQRAWHGETVKP
jgi:hypothetical protein